MARHYLEAISLDGSAYKHRIPAPSIDMTTGRQRFGASGNYVSGGGYVRRSQHGAQRLEVSWNNLDTDGTNRLLQLEESGPFVWDNPMARRNVALPWMGSHGSLDIYQPGAYGYSTATYLFQGEGIEYDGVYTDITNWFTRYPYSNAKYVIDSPRIDNLGAHIFLVPKGFEARVWAVGEATGNARIVMIGQHGTDVPWNWAASPGGYPTDYVTLPEEGVHYYTIAGAGELTLVSLQIRIVPVGAPEEPLTYSPGLGNSGMEFTEEGLQLVQHSAALDMQSAAATWLETGWWK